MLTPASPLAYQWKCSVRMHCGPICKQEEGTWQLGEGTDDTDTQRKTLRDLRARLD